MAMALERALALDVEGEILVVTNHEQAALVAASCKGLSTADKSRIVVLGEPKARNTAPAVDKKEEEGAAEGAATEAPKAAEKKSN